MEIQKRTFTIRDLLILTAVVAVLAFMFLPNVRVAREAARRTQCSNNLKQYGLGIHNYHDTFKQIPPPGTGGAAPQVSWHVRILPFCEQVPLYEQINFKYADARQWPIPKPNNPNALAWSHQVPYAKCPDDMFKSILWDRAQASYAGNLGSNRVPSANDNCNPWLTPDVHYEYQHGRWDFGDSEDRDQVSGPFGRYLFDTGNFGTIKDGTANTFFVGEILGDCHDHREGWWSWNGMANAHASTSAPLNTMTTCVDLHADAVKRRYFKPQCFAKNNWNFSWGFRSNHPTGANFLMGDGTVQFINTEINYNIYQKYGGKAEGLPVSP